MGQGATENYYTVISFSHGCCISVAIYNNCDTRICDDFVGGTLVRAQPNYTNIFFCKFSITFKLVNINDYDATTAAPPHYRLCCLSRQRVQENFPVAYAWVTCRLPTCYADFRFAEAVILCCCPNLLEQFALFSCCFFGAYRCNFACITRISVLCLLVLLCCYCCSLASC